jgi:hypothetical protein
MLNALNLHNGKGEIYRWNQHGSVASHQSAWVIAVRNSLIQSDDISMNIAVNYQRFTSDHLKGRFPSLPIRQNQNIELRT